MILITSAAYSSPALITEFGKLPPCMLPVQNRRLYQHQLELFQGDEKIVISLPSDYILTESDSIYFKEHCIQTVYVPLNLCLGASVVYVLNVIADYNEPLRILHGDTLIDDIPEEYDTFLISETKDDYSWRYYDIYRKYAYIGYFSFSSQSELIRSITECNNNFIDGVADYGKRIKINPQETKTWLDFGISTSYYRSKSKMTTQRVFNDLEISHFSVKKRSSDQKKILAEAHWFNSLPKALKHYAPSLWDCGIEDSGKGFYEIEYFYLSSLADLFVFGKNPAFVWKSILNSCAEFIGDITKYTPDNKSYIAEKSVLLYGKKTAKRLISFCDSKGIDLGRSWIINAIPVPCLNDILSDVTAQLKKVDNEFISMIHGDFCFSNILYDFVSRSIKVIDPRGLDALGNETIYGDIRYDVAKLSHSILGMYDYIIGGNYRYSEDGDYKLFLEFPIDETLLQVQQYFKEMSFAGYSITQLKIYPIMILLFLSMLPLHDDNPSRQRAMLANALRLYVEYKSQNYIE